MRTYSPSSTEISSRWSLVDARGQVLGRLAGRIAQLLMGKNQTNFARPLPIGDQVVVVNARNVVVTGRKATQKLYHRHSGYPGGMKVTLYKDLLATHPERIIIHAVSGMLPQNKIQATMLKRLHVYPDANHPYTSQVKSDKLNV